MLEGTIDPDMSENNYVSSLAHLWTFGIKPACRAVVIVMETRGPAGLVLAEKFILILVLRSRR